MAGLFCPCFLLLATFTTIQASFILTGGGMWVVHAVQNIDDR